MTYANVVSSLCLFIVLGGAAYAAVTLPKNSVGTKQLKKNAVIGSKIKGSSVVSSDVRDGSLLAKDFGAGQLPAGPKGDKGDKGDSGLGALEGWQSLAFASGWSNYETGFATVSFRKDQLGRVYLRGLAEKSGGTPALEDVIGTLPEGYRPTGRLIFEVATGEPHSGGRVDVLPDGTVRWEGGSTTEFDYTSLSTISFSTD